VRDEEADRIFYHKGNVLQKFQVLRASYLIRKADLKRLNEFDLVFVFRESQMTRSFRFEREVAKRGIKMIFDFDDVIWMMNISAVNQRFSFAKNPEKTSKCTALADRVIAGNDYLAAYARQFNSEVTVIPTTVDTDRLTSHRPFREDQHLSSGWTGSHTTIQYLELLIPVLAAIKEKYPSVKFRFIGDPTLRTDLPDTEILAWTSKTEVEDLSQLDIGVMPLKDDKWAQRKCRLKGLTYMSLNVAAIMSPVGSNSTIIQHGVNGFLADSHEEWFHRIEELILNPELRRKMGEKGRQTVIEKYSIHANKDKYLALFNELCNEQK
jgi:glycosyltransferase involved in cell wall biosynthesis